MERPASRDQSPAVADTGPDVVQRALVDEEVDPGHGEVGAVPGGDAARVASLPGKRAEASVAEREMLSDSAGSRAFRGTFRRDERQPLTSPPEDVEIERTGNPRLTLLDLEETAT